MYNKRMAGMGLELSDPTDFSNVTTSGAQYGDGGKFGAAFQSIRARGPRYDKTEATGVATRAEEKSASMLNQADVKATGILADAKVEAAEEAYKVQKKAANQAKSRSTMGGIFGAVASIGGALLSDEKTKNTIEPLESALATLRKLKPVTFYYNKEYSSQPERRHHGFIAQEYVKVLPEATYFDDDSGNLCIDTRELIAILVRANQELETRVARLELQQVPQGVK